MKANRITSCVAIVIALLLLLGQRCALANCR